MNRKEDIGTADLLDVRRDSARGTVMSHNELWTYVRVHREAIQTLLHRRFHRGREGPTALDVHSEWKGKGKKTRGCLEVTSVVRIGHLPVTVVVFVGCRLDTEPMHKPLDGTMSSLSREMNEREKTLSIHLFVD